MKKTGTLILTAALIRHDRRLRRKALNATDPSTDLSAMTSTSETTAETSPAPAYEGPKTFEELYGNQIVTPPVTLVLL